MDQSDLYVFLMEVYGDLSSSVPLSYFCQVYTIFTVDHSCIITHLHYYPQQVHFLFDLRVIFTLFTSEKQTGRYIGSYNQMTLLYS